MHRLSGLQENGKTRLNEKIQIQFFNRTFMEELYLWFGLSIGLAAFGCIWTVMTGFKERRRVLDSLKMDYSVGEDKEEQPGFPFQSLVYILLAVPPLTHTVLVAILIFIFSPLTEPQLVVAKGALLCIGLSALFGNLGCSMMYAEAMEGLGKSDKQYYGRYMLFLVLPETIVIHGLLLAILGLTLSGIIGEPVALSIETADIYFQACLLLGISGVAALFMGSSFRRAPSLVESSENYVTKIFRTLAPVALNITALVIALWLMLDSGFFA